MLYGNFFNISLDKLDSDYVRDISSNFCHDNQNIFKVSDAAIERGCINSLFNQILLKINAQRDKLFIEKENLKSLKKQEKYLEEQANAVKV